MSRGRGRPFQPGNNSGKGRPRGSKNKTSAEAAKIFRDYSPAVTRKCLEMALKGDLKAIRMSLDRSVPELGDQPVRVGLLPLRTVTDVADASEMVVRKVTIGELTIQQGTELANIIEMRRRAIETQELDGRVRILEQSHQVRPLDALAA